MRYYQKLVSLLVLVLAASFGVGGCVLLYSDFAVQRGRMATANASGPRPDLYLAANGDPRLAAPRHHHG